MIPAVVLLVFGFWVLAHSQFQSFQNYQADNQRLNLVFETLARKEALSDKIITLDNFLGDNLEFRASKKLDLLLTRNRLFRLPKKRIGEQGFAKEFSKNIKSLAEILKSNGLDEKTLQQLYQGLTRKESGSRYMFLVGAYLFNHLDFWPPFSMSKSAQLEKIEFEEIFFVKTCQESQARSELKADLFILTESDIIIFKPSGFLCVQVLGEGVHFYWRKSFDQK